MLIPPAAPSGACAACAPVVTSRDDGVDEGRAGADGDERVHVGGAVAQGGPRAAVEGRAAVADDGRGERQLQPVHPPDVEERNRAVRHGDDEHGQAERGGHGAAAQQVAPLGAARLLLAVEPRALVGARHLAHAVAQFLDPLLQSAGVGGRLQELDADAHRRQVEARADDAARFLQVVLQDLRRAGDARRVVDDEVGRGHARGAVAHVPDRLDQLAHARPSRVVRDGGALGGEVHVGLRDAGRFRQTTLDAPRARRTGHARDGQVDAHGVGRDRAGRA